MPEIVSVATTSPLDWLSEEYRTDDGARNLAQPSSTPGLLVTVPSPLPPRPRWTSGSDRLLPGTVTALARGGARRNR